jgi:hypothetical protein
MFILVFVVLGAGLLSGIALGFVVPLWAVIDCATTESSTARKVIWIVAIFFTGGFAAIFYAFLSDNRALKRTTLVSLLAFPTLVVIFFVTGMTLPGRTISLGGSAKPAVFHPTVAAPATAASYAPVDRARLRQRSHETTRVPSNPSNISAEAMSIRHPSSRVALIAAMSLGIVTPARVSGVRTSATTVDLSMATLHAAVLTSSRAPGDSIDNPYVLVSVLEPGSGAAAVALPATGHLHIHRNEALGARPLTRVRLNTGDTVRVLFSVLEGGAASAAIEEQAATAAARALGAATPERVRAIATALSPLTSQGAHLLGSATLLLTRNAETTYWRGLDCAATCKVLSGAEATPLPAPDKTPSAGVIELSGAGATYHMKIEARQTR